MKTARLRALFVVAGTATLAGAYHHSTTVALMSGSAREFVRSLDNEQAREALFPMDAESRTFWHFIPSVDVALRYPHPRPGLTLEKMTPEQRHLASALLSAGLSRDGYRKAETIMSLEAVLRAQEQDSGVRRNPLKYHFSIFGTPSEKAVWGYRVEGHHLSLHYTLAGGRLSAAPTFFGANPRQVRQGPRKGLRTLPREEDLGRSLVQALTPEQSRVAIVSAKAYRDILTSADREAVLDTGQPSGLVVSKMTATQHEILDELVSEYAGNMPGDVAAHRMKLYRQAGDNIHFAWAGPTESGAPHYYRVQTPTFLIEYDCTQNGANHIHTVWREFDGDFGRDLLREHYQRKHR